MLAIKVCKVLLMDTIPRPSLHLFCLQAGGGGFKHTNKGVSTNFHSSSLICEVTYATTSSNMVLQPSHKQEPNSIRTRGGTTVQHCSHRPAQPTNTVTTCWSYLHILECFSAVFTGISDVVEKIRLQRA